MRHVIFFLCVWNVCCLVSPVQAAGLIELIALPTERLAKKIASKYQISEQESLAVARALKHSVDDATAGISGSPAAARGLRTPKSKLPSLLSGLEYFSKRGILKDASRSSILERLNAEDEAERLNMEDLSAALMTLKALDGSQGIEKRVEAEIRLEASGGKLLTKTASVKRPKNVERFSAYLNYFNKTNPKKVSLDKWFSLVDLIRSGNDMVSFMETASREGLLFVVEERPHESLGTTRYLAQLTVSRGYQDASVVYPTTFGLNYERSLKDGTSYVAWGDESVSLTDVNYGSYYKEIDIMFYIPSTKEFQELDYLHLQSRDARVESLLKSVSRPRWKE